VDVYFVWICVYSFFKASRDIFVLVCVSLDLFWYCVVMMCGFLCYICVLTVLVCYFTEAGTGLIICITKWYGTTNIEFTESIIKQKKAELSTGVIWLVELAGGEADQGC
jgi:hypothetical protein